MTALTCFLTSLCTGWKFSCSDCGFTSPCRLFFWCKRFAVGSFFIYNALTGAVRVISRKFFFLLPFRHHRVPSRAQHMPKHTFLISYDILFAVVNFTTESIPRVQFLSINNFNVSPRRVRGSFAAKFTMQNLFRQFFSLLGAPSYSTVYYCKVL